MARVKRSVNGKKHRRAVLESARGYTGSRSRHFKAANEQVMHSLRYAYRDRRARKGEIRRGWIVHASRLPFSIAFFPILYMLKRKSSFRLEAMSRIA